MWSRATSRLVAAAERLQPRPLRSLRSRPSTQGRDGQRQGAGLALGAGAALTGLLLVPSCKFVLLEEKPKSPVRRPAGTVNVDQEMLRLRQIFLTGDINDDTAKVLVQQLLYLEAEDPHAPVTIFINSGGGLVHSGLAILDAMCHASMPVKTVAYGRCFSIAAILLASGTPGHRSAYPNARLMIHEPSCAYNKMQVSDLLVKIDELRHTKELLEGLLATRTGRPQADIAAAVERDNYMSATEAKNFGLVDHILEAKSAPANATTKESVPSPVQAPSLTAPSSPETAVPAVQVGAGTAP